MKCPDCGAEMKPLFQWNMFCPNDCDRKDEFKVEEDTPRYRISDCTIRNTDSGLDNITFENCRTLNTDEDQTDEQFIEGLLDSLFVAVRCPDCTSKKTDPFIGGPAGTTTHCWDCGHVW
jgi:ribosomal protein S27E